MHGSDQTNSSNSNEHDGDGDGIDLHLAINDRWAVLDLDELRESIQAAGLPAELIATYRDQHGHRRYIERRPRRAHTRQETAA